MQIFYNKAATFKEKTVGKGLLPIIFQKTNYIKTLHTNKVKQNYKLEHKH